SVSSSTSASTGGSGGGLPAAATEICNALCDMLVDCGVMSNHAQCVTDCETALATCDGTELTTIASCIDVFTDCAAAMTAKSCVDALPCVTAL
ncbi:MAG: hypothetical protein VB934_14355, partial [Polyangiaceae bacterium]